MTGPSVEVNLDGMVGPTHNFAGLGSGNTASMAHRSRVSSPRRAALEGLAKMKLLMDLGIPQAVLVPQERPALHTLRALGFEGSDARVVEHAAREAPTLLAACYSSSSMWAANACTVSASADTHGGRTHFTPANLISNLHRSIEPAETSRLFEKLFSDDTRFVVHPPLPASVDMADEGAANHLRLAPDHAAPGLEIFVYGRDRSMSPESWRFIPRQTRAASEAIARRHRLDPAAVLFIRQNQEAIDAGVFHNDVICTSHLNLLIAHEKAFDDQDAAIELIKETYNRFTGAELQVIQIPSEIITLQDAVVSYLFNGQIVSIAPDEWVMIAPTECQKLPAARLGVRYILEHAPQIRHVHYVGMTQSMWNGGGPGCTRLRVPMSQADMAHCHRPMFLTPELYQRLVDIVERYYPASLSPRELADPALIRSTRQALDAISQALELPGLYRFQQE